MEEPAASVIGLIVGLVVCALAAALAITLPVLLVLYASGRLRGRPRLARAVARTAVRAGQPFQLAAPAPSDGSKMRACLWFDVRHPGPGAEDYHLVVRYQVRVGGAPVIERVVELGDIARRAGSPNWSGESEEPGWNLLSSPATLRSLFILDDRAAISGSPVEVHGVVDALDGTALAEAHVFFVRG